MLISEDNSPYPFSLSASHSERFFKPYVQGNLEYLAETYGVWHTTEKGQEKIWSYGEVHMYLLSPTQVKFSVYKANRGFTFKPQQEIVVDYPEHVLAEVVTWAKVFKAEEILRARKAREEKAAWAAEVAAVYKELFGEDSK